MSLKMLGNNIPYDNCYHFTFVTKYRENLFMEEPMRSRIGEIISDIIERHDHLEVIAFTVAYNHVHVLLRSDMTPSKIAQILSGTSSRYIRKEYPVLVEIIPKRLWGGKSCMPIVDRNHLENCISYLQRHQPDNSKSDEGI